jgi:hypothetical protein
MSKKQAKRPKPHDFFFRPPLPHQVCGPEAKELGKKVGGREEEEEKEGEKKKMALPKYCVL